MGIPGGGGEEATKLLGGKVDIHNVSYGSVDSDLTGTESRLSDEDVTKIPLRSLFRYSTRRDKWIIGIGTLFAIVHGAGFPLLALVFGKMTDTFIRQAIYGFRNTSTQDSNNGSAGDEERNSSATPISFSEVFAAVSAAISSSPSPLVVEGGDYFDFNVNPDPEIPFGESNHTVQNGTVVMDQLNFNLSKISVEEFIHFMNLFAIYFVGVGVVVLIASFSQAVCWEWSCERQAYRLRQEFFYQVLRQEIAWFDKHLTGDLSLKLSDDLERIREGIGHKFSMVIQFLSTFVMGLVVGLITSWRLTLVIISLTPLLAATSAFSGKMIATQSAREQQKYGKAGGVAEEVLSCIRTVAAFGGEKREIRRYSTALAAGLRTAIKKYHVFSIAIGTVFFLMYGSYALAFWYGCQLLNDGLISPGDVFTVFFSVLLGAFSLGNAIPFAAIIRLAQGCGAVVFNIIDSMPNIDPYSRDGIMPEKLTGHIQFRSLSFSYPQRSSVPILEDFNLDIEPGKTVAIVGLSGSGKTTIVNLILRFYDPESGLILIDGNDLKALNLAWVRSHIGYVAQEPVLFGTTIYENIRYGRDDACPEEVIHAAKMAYAHDFITALPQGYNTLLGERGSQLSGGEKQRIAIARALIRDPKILLLDEATSALDSKSEAVVQAALDRATKGRTTIIIAHRLSTVIDADAIYVLNSGKIAEKGTHGSLMAKEGHYYNLVMSQTSVEEIPDFSATSADESGAGDESCKELSLLLATNQLNNYKRVRRKYRKRPSFPKKSLVIPDPDKIRLMKEASELNVTYPGIWKILKVNRPEWFLLIMGGVGCVGTGFIMPIFAFFYSEMFSTFLLQGRELLDAAFFWSMMFLVLSAVSFVAYWLRTIFVASAGEYLTMRLRLHSFASIVRQPMGWFDKEANSSSRLSTRLARDAPIVKAAAGHRLAVLVSSFVTSATALGIAFYFGWQLALVVLAGAPILMFSGYIQVQVQKSGQKKDAVMMEDAGRCANEAIANIRTVQSLAQERIFFAKYFELLFPIYVEAHRQGLYYGVAFAVSEAVIFLIYAGSFRYGAYLVQIGVMDSMTIYKVFFAIAFCSVSVGQATSWIPDYTKANLAAGLIFHLIEQQSSIDPFSDGGLRPVLTGRINFKEVHFRYPSRPDVPVLRGLTFEVKPGQTLALVGPSGCGKSTVTDLLERFYDAVGGHVMVDGYDVRSLNIQHLRAHIGVVTQEPVVFDTSIRSNIAYGYGDGLSAPVPDELVVEAAKFANAHHFIMALPRGYDTLVGERGVMLSGGQKQRIAIARALIRDPRILLLDEATSALDTENEKVVQEALDKARAGRTCIVIAHRLSTIVNADCIAVISRGRIVEMGTHDQLRSARCYYYRLTKNQQISH